MVPEQTIVKDGASPSGRRVGGDAAPVGAAHRKGRRVWARKAPPGKTCCTDVTAGRCVLC